MRSRTSLLVALLMASSLVGMASRAVMSPERRPVDRICLGSMTHRP